MTIKHFKIRGDAAKVERDAWIAFMAARLSCDNEESYEQDARIADKSLEEFRKRFVYPDKD